MARSRPCHDRNRAVLRARDLRRAPTPPEFRLWQILRHRPDGLKFRRQHPFEGCTVDFYCPAAKLVIEVDGDAHGMGDHPRRDAERDAWLQSEGLKVLRYDAADVMRNVEAVVISILAACAR